VTGQFDLSDAAPASRRDLWAALDLVWRARRGVVRIDARHRDPAGDVLAWVEARDVPVSIGGDYSPGGRVMRLRRRPAPGTRVGPVFVEVAYRRPERRA
jgi:hypothetical protein